MVDTRALIQQSGIYETAAWGLEDQPSFFNQVLRATTGLIAKELLRCY